MQVADADEVRFRMSHSYQGWLFHLRNWPLAQRDRRFVNGITYRLASLCAWL